MTGKRFFKQLQNETMAQLRSLKTKIDPRTYAKFQKDINNPNVTKARLLKINILFETVKQTENFTIKSHKEAIKQAKQQPKPKPKQLIKLKPIPDVNLDIDNIYNPRKFLKEVKQIKRTKRQLTKIIDELKENQSSIKSYDVKANIFATRHYKNNKKELWNSMHKSIRMQSISIR